MFQFAAFALPTYVFSRQWPFGRVAPFGNLRITACLLAPRSLSQATTSFIAGYRLGIHHVHLVTCPYNVSFWRLLSSLKAGSSPKTGYSSSFYYWVFYCVAVAQVSLYFYDHHSWQSTWITLYYYVCSIQSQPIYAKHSNCKELTSRLNVLINKLQLFLLYFFRIVKERNYLLDPKDQT